MPSTLTFTRTADGDQRIRIDSPGQSAQSYPIPDAMAFIAMAASELGLEADDSVEGQLTISPPPGG